MKKYHRTTITIPQEIYQKIKTKAAFQNKSVSGFITDTLRRTTITQHTEKPLLPLGKYNLNSEEFNRRKIYEPYLRRKVSR